MAENEIVSVNQRIGMIQPFFIKLRYFILRLSTLFCPWENIFKGVYDNNFFKLVWFDGLD